MYTYKSCKVISVNMSLCMGFAWLQLVVVEVLSKVVGSKWPIQKSCKIHDQVNLINELMHGSL